jgi:hypothetical protein
VKENKEEQPMQQFLVTPLAKRPAAPNENRCFYCLQEVGSFHKHDCVLVKKKLRVRVVIEYLTEVPAYWNKEAFEFHHNDGTWCKSNLIKELQEFDYEVGCLCHCAQFEMLEDSDKYYLKED